jgi:hypothetical protein
MKKSLPGSNKEVRSVIDAQKKFLYKFLTNGKFSMKVVYTLIDVLTTINYDDRYMYTDL